MAFSYSGDPSTSIVDAVRFLTQDVDASEVFLQDEEIAFLVVLWQDKQSVYFTASMACEAIASKFAREVTVTSDSQTVNTSELQDKYIALAQRLMGLHVRLLSGGNVDVGGINIGEQPDPTVSPPAFGTKMHDFIEAGVQDLGDVQERLPMFWSEEWWIG